jgi:hypothetical protein
MGTGFYLASSTLNIAFMAMLLWRANSLPSWARLRIRHKARLSLGSASMRRIEEGDELNFYEWHIVLSKNYDVTITGQLLVINRDD